MTNIIGWQGKDGLFILSNGKSAKPTEIIGNPTIGSPLIRTETNLWRVVGNETNVDCPSEVCPVR